MSDYETFQKWAVEADDRINGRTDLSNAYITGLPALELINWNDPKKAAFMAAIAARRRLKIALDRLHADGLVYEAMVAMNILDESAYGYIDYDSYDDDYPWPDGPPQQPSNMFSHENGQFTPCMHSDELSDSLRTLIAAPSLRRLDGAWGCVAQTVGSTADVYKWQADADVYAATTQDGVTIKGRSGRIIGPDYIIPVREGFNSGALQTFPPDPKSFDPSPDSGVVHQMAQTVGAMSDFQERYERAVMDAMRCGAGSFKGPSGAQITAEDLTWPRSPSYYTPEQEETIALGYRNLPKAHELHDSIALTIAEQLRCQQADMMATDDHQSPLDAIGEDVLNTVIAPVKQGQPTAKPQAHTDPYFSPAAQHDMEPVEVWCKPKTGKAYRHCIRPRKAAEELVARNNSQYRGVAEYWIEP